MPVRAGLGVGVNRGYAGYAGGGAVTTYVQDDFTDTNGTALASHVPNVNTAGSGWTVFGASFIIINTNQALIQFGTAGGHRINCGVANGVYRVRMVNAPMTSGGRVVFRFTDTDNHYQFNVDSAGTQTTLYKHQGGVVTQIDQKTGLSITMPIDLTITLNGNSISCAVDGMPSATCSGSDAFNATETYIGIWNDPDTGRYDNLSFKSA